MLVYQLGAGVPDSRKGIFSTHAATITKTLKGAHVTIQARSDEDVTPELIRKRLEESGGSRYSINKEAPVKMSAPAPVGSAYVPVGRPDIASLTAKAPRPEAPTKVGTAYESKRDELASIRAAQDRPIPTPPAPTTPSPPAAPFKAPSAPFNSLNRSSGPSTGAFSSLTRPSAVTAPTQFANTITSPIEDSSDQAPEPKALSSRVSSPAPPKASESRERPEAVGTAYEPVSLGKPGKLGNRWNFAGNQQDNKPSVPSPMSTGRNVSSGGKLTWSERQAQAKKLQEEEDARASGGFQASETAAPVAPPAPSIGRSQISMPLGADSDEEPEQEEEEESIPAR